MNIFGKREVENDHNIEIMVHIIIKHSHSAYIVCHNYTDNAVTIFSLTITRQPVQKCVP